MVAPFASGFEQVLVSVVVFFDSVFDQYTGIGECFDKLFPHDFFLPPAVVWIRHILIDKLATFCADVHCDYRTRKL
jgi:hypothetical protein